MSNSASHAALLFCLYKGVQHQTKAGLAACWPLLPGTQALTHVMVLPLLLLH